MTQRRVDGFFYGLFMDPDVLGECGVAPHEPRPAYADGFQLRIGNRATLIPALGARAYGMVYALTHDDLNKLHATPGLEDYRPEAVTAQVIDGTPLPALCYNLLEAPAPDEANPDYAERLRAALARLGFPADYIATVS